MFKTEDELLAFFMDDGCMVDTVTGDVYISDTTEDGRFYGIFLYEPVPEDCRHDYNKAMNAYEYGNWKEFDVPGQWFGNLAEMVMAEPDRFLTE